MASRKRHNKTARQGGYNREDGPHVARKRVRMRLKALPEMKPAERPATPDCDLLPESQRIGGEDFWPARIISLDKLMRRV